MPQDREPVRVPASRLDRDLDIVGIPSGRMEHGRVDPTLAHLLQAILGAVAGDLPVLPGRRALRPDMDLRVDDQHGGPPSRFRSGPVMLRDVGRLRIVTRAAAPRAGRAQPRRIKLGTGVVPVPDRNPLMVANRIIQLDHVALAKAGVGRVMFGAGHGLLNSDAMMLGIDPMAQRDRMMDVLEIILCLFRGETVTGRTDWFTLENARAHLLPYTRPYPEIAVASVVTPSAGSGLACRASRRACRPALMRSTPTGTSPSRSPPSTAAAWTPRCCVSSARAHR